MASEYTPEQLEAIKTLNLDINALTEAQRDLIEDIGKLHKNSKKSLEEQIKDLELMASLYDDQTKQLEANVLKEKLALKANEDRYKSLKEQYKAAEGNVEKQEELAAEMRECEESARGLTENLKKANAELEQSTQKAKSFNDRFQELGRKAQEFIGNLVNIKNSIVGIVSSIDDMTGGFNFPSSVLFSFDKLVATLKAAAQEVVKSLQTVTTSTGVVLSAHNQILNQGLGKYAIANKELAESFSNLYSNMNQFSNLNAKEQANLTASAAKMKNLGVDTKVYAQNLQLLNNSFGMTASASNKTLEELAQKAREAGITPQKMFADLNTSMGNLAAYGGKKALEVFVEMQKQSKALGIEIGKLNGIVGNTWDTFEGAAQRAGGLNAILGGDFLNATQMLNATESERVMLLKKSIEASGQNWQSMDKFQKLSIMNTLGIKDQAEAEALFGKSVSQTEDQMKKKVNTETTLAQAQLAGADAMRKLELAQRGQAAAAKQMVESLQKLVEMFNKLIEGHEGTIAKVTIFMGILTPLIGIFMGLATAVTSIIGLFAALKAAFAGGGRGAANVIRQIGQAAQRSVFGILALGAAVWMMGKGIAAAAEGMAVLVKSFADLKSAEQIQGAVTAIGYVMLGMVVAIALLIPLIYALGSAGTAGAIGLLAIGAAFMLVGLGIALAAAGFFLVATSMAIMADKGVKLGQVVVVLLSLAGVLALMTLGLAALSGASFIAIPALTALSIAFLSIGAGFALAGAGIALALNPINDLANKEGVGARLSDVAKGIGEIALSIAGLLTGSLFGGDLDDVADMVDDLIISFNKMPSDVSIRASAFKDLSVGIKDVATVTAASLAPANEFVNNVKTLYETQTKSANAQNDMFMAMIKGISKLGEKDKKEGEIEIVLRVDDQNFKGYIGASAVGSKLPKPA